jgi:hypothetical protein
MWERGESIPERNSLLQEVMPENQIMYVFNLTLSLYSEKIQCVNDNMRHLTVTGGHNRPLLWNVTGNSLLLNELMVAAYVRAFLVNVRSSCSQ